MNGQICTLLQKRDMEDNANNNADKKGEKGTDSSAAEKTGGEEDASDHSDADDIDATCEDVKASTMSTAASKSLSVSLTDQEFNELFDAALERANRELAHEQIADEQEESDDELQDAGNMDDPQHHNIHSDLVTPELSAEDQQKPSSPPKLSHKKLYKKRSPSTDRNKNRSRKLEYQSPVQDVPLHKAIKRKLLPNSNPKVKKQRVSKKKQLQERSIQEDGTWVQCMHSECMKWRYLRNVTDPSLIPEYWVCEKNSDPEYNSCDKFEEDWHCLEFVYTKFTEGSIVWAKMQGYPWWPAMVEEDPDTGTYCEQKDTETYPTQFHVVFLDTNVSRTWLKTSSVRNFEAEEDMQTKAKGKSFKLQLSHAVARAKKALSMKIQDRIKTFGFSHTFKGKIVEDSQDSVEVQVESEGSDKDQYDDETKDEDVELDLEMLGVDVDEILEQAEALLSEAGETVQPLQEASITGDFPEKKKRGRKRKKTESENNTKDKKVKEVKVKRNQKEKSKGDEKSKADRKEKKHKSHHHHSKKDKKMGVKEDPKAENTEKDENQKDGKITQDIKSNEVKDEEVQHETQNKETIEGNLSPKKIKKRRSKKRAAAQVGDQDQTHKATDGENGETEEDKSSARSKKDEKKMDDPNHQISDKTLQGEVVQGAVKVTAKKVKELKVKTSDGETKIKKPRVRKVVAPKQKSENSAVTSEIASDGNKNSTSKDATSTPKAKKSSKKHEAAPKMKPTFKPPSKPKKDIQMGMQKAPFQAPLMKAEPFLEKEHKKENAKDGADDDKAAQDSEFNTTANDRNSHENIGKENKSQVQEDPSKKSSKKDKVETKGKASKFSIKKKNPTDENPSPVTSVEPNKNAATSSITEEKQVKQKKKAPSKKFSIKQKPAETANLPSLTPVQQITHEFTKTEESDEGRSEISATSAEKLDVKKPGPLTKSAPKKFSIKRKEAPTDTNTEVKSDQTSKVAESIHQEEQSQGVFDDDELLLDLDDNSLTNDIAMAIEKLEEEGDGDSDDFSMDDLTDWPKDTETKDEVREDNPAKLPQLADGNGANSQPFELVEE